jgi:DNA polymerase-1
VRGSLRFIADDTETHLIRPGCPVPKMVCLSYAEFVPESEIPEGFLPTEEDPVSRWYKSYPNHLERFELTWRHPKAAEVPEKYRYKRVGLMDATTGAQQERLWLRDYDVTVVGHNKRFDLAVCAAELPRLLPIIFRAYEEGRILDTIVRQQLCDIATGSMKYHEDEDTGEVTHTEYGLDKLTYRLLKRWLGKKDTWRLKYALLDGVPLTEWPEEAITYALLDSICTLDIWLAQETLAGAKIPNSEEQHKADFALYLMSIWGVRTDPKMVPVLREKLAKEYAEKMLALRPTGLIRYSPPRALKAGPRKGQMIPEENTKDQKTIRARVQAAYEAKGLDVPMTDNEEAPQISMSRKTLKGSGEKDLTLLAEVGVVAKLLQTYIPILESGTVYPICCRYNVLVETGRTSCSSPNNQNPPRGFRIREAFVPRKGWVYIFADYSGLELCTLSQVCLDQFGYSEMADALLLGQDLHLALAADMLGITYEEAKKRSKDGDAEIKHYRQQAKPANFGFPGGMGADSFREYAEQYGINLTVEQAKELKDAWLRKWGVMREYFQWITELMDSGGPVEQARSGRLRGGASFCAAANGMFQGLAADGAKRALWFVARECYLEDPWSDVPDPTTGTCHPGRTALFGCRPVLFIHDEIGAECPFDDAHPEKASAAADRLSEVMVAAMKYFVPDVPIKADPTIVRRWYKGAEPVRQNGVLLPCRPVEEIGPDGKKKTHWIADLVA